MKATMCSCRQARSMSISATKCETVLADCVHSDLMSLMATSSCPSNSALYTCTCSFVSACRVGDACNGCRLTAATSYMHAQQEEASALNGCFLGTATDNATRSSSLARHRCSSSFPVRLLAYRADGPIAQFPVSAILAHGDLESPGCDAPVQVQSLDPELTHRMTHRMGGVRGRLVTGQGWLRLLCAAAEAGPP